MAVRIGELLLKEKCITPEQLQQALQQQKANGGKLGFNLVRLGFVKDEEITALLSKQYGVPSINLAQFEIEPSVIKLIPADTAQKYQIVPLSRAGSTLTIAMTDPTNVFAMDDIKFMTGYNVEPVVASETAVGEAIDKYYPSKAAKPTVVVPSGPSCARESRPKASKNCRRSKPATSRSSRISRRSAPKRSPSRARKRRSSGSCNVVMMSAIQKGASDIHIEPNERNCASATASTEFSTTS